MKIALVHDWLTTFGGAERVLLTLHEMFPDAPIYTTIYNPKNLPQFKNADIRTSFLNSFPMAKTRHQVLIPFTPKAIESFDLRQYDLIISDSHASAKGAIKAKNAKHLCYCHTPFRYIWFPEIDNRSNTSLLRRLASNYLRKWDLKTKDRPDQYLANSKYIQERIKTIYNRDSEVVYPPIDTSLFQTADKPEDYFLFVARLVSHKKPEIVVQAFNDLQLPLKVVGTGPQLEILKKLAKPNIEFTGRVTDDQLKHFYSHCQALIFPSIDDFGMIPVEVMASGRPVISLNIGGAAESVIPGVTGLHFDKQTPASIIEVVNKFQSKDYNPQIIRQKSEQFDTNIFKQKITQAVDKLLSP